MSSSDHKNVTGEEKEEKQGGFLYEDEDEDEEEEEEDDDDDEEEWVSTFVRLHSLHLRHQNNPVSPRFSIKKDDDDEDEDDESRLGGMTMSAGLMRMLGMEVSEEVEITLQRYPSIANSHFYSFVSGINSCRLGPTHYGWSG